MNIAFVLFIMFLGFTGCAIGVRWFRIEGNGFVDYCMATIAFLYGLLVMVYGLSFFHS